MACSLLFLENMCRHQQHDVESRYIDWLYYYRTKVAIHPSVRPTDPVTRLLTCRGFVFSTACLSNVASYIYDGMGSYCIGLRTTPWAGPCVRACVRRDGGRRGGRRARSSAACAKERYYVCVDMAWGQYIAWTQHCSEHCYTVYILKLDVACNTDRAINSMHRVACIN